MIHASRPNGEAVIQTVLGDVEPDALGLCLPHEHVWCDQSLAPRADLYGSFHSPEAHMRLNDFSSMVEELRAFAAEGGGAIVEVTCDGWGRDLEMLARLSEASGVHIVATAGYYIEPCIPWYVDTLSTQALADHITAELEHGINGRRCGILKSAIHQASIEGVELRVLRAVAIAQLRTGVPITTHSTGGRSQELAGGNVALQQLTVLEEYGVRPDRLIVGHVDIRPNIDTLSYLASKGCYIQFDVIDKEHWLLDATRIDILVELIRRGHVERILLSHDRNRNHEMLYGSGGGYSHLLTEFLPQLAAAGLSESTLRTLTVHNPARALTPTF